MSENNKESVEKEKILARKAELEKELEAFEFHAQQQIVAYKAGIRVLEELLNPKPVVKES